MTNLVIIQPESAAQALTDILSKKYNLFVFDTVSRFIEGPKNPSDYRTATGNPAKFQSFDKLLESAENNEAIDDNSYHALLLEPNLQYERQGLPIFENSLHKLPEFILRNIPVIVYTSALGLIERAKEHGAFYVIERKDKPELQIKQIEGAVNLSVKKRRDCFEYGPHKVHGALDTALENYRTEPSFSNRLTFLATLYRAVSLDPSMLFKKSADDVSSLEDFLRQYIKATETPSQSSTQA
ncbi:hypothetical protein KY328_04090 [Candidatus Woesearchaeota archaeon]|nr:hypothetical protein [Candidatus Woesearchaeota archaeon]MBW3022078.1 hypothetical protein [Candidatus Woesearchaeota archaeon]